MAKAKVKVSKEVFDALEDALKVQHFGYDEMLRLNLFGYFSNEREVLNDLGAIELAEILINGYELKKTPEEEIRELYKLAKIMTAINVEYNSGYIDGIKATLDKLNIKIEGVN